MRSSTKRTTTRSKVTPAEPTSAEVSPVQEPRKLVFTRYKNGTGEPNNPPKHGDTVYEHGEPYIYHGPKGEYLPLKEYQALKNPVPIHADSIYDSSIYVDRRRFSYRSRF